MDNRENDINVESIPYDNNEMSSESYSAVTVKSKQNKSAFTMQSSILKYRKYCDTL